MALGAIEALARKLQGRLKFLNAGDTILSGPVRYTMLDGKDSVYLAQNCYWDGTNWQRYNTGAAASVFYVNSAGLLRFNSVAAGANPIAAFTNQGTVTQAQFAALGNSTVADSGWLTGHTFGTNWSSFGGTWTVRYRKLPSGLVVLQGLAAKSAALALPETMLTLPAGYRPGVATGGTGIIHECTASGGRAEVRVFDTGVVQLNAGGSATWTSVGGISFLAEN